MADTEHDISVACRHTETEKQERLEGLVERLPPVEGVHEAVRVRFPNAEGIVGTLAAFVERERACCPFLTITLRFHPDDGAVDLVMEGPEGTAELAREGLGELRRRRG